MNEYVHIRTGITKVAKTEALNMTIVSVLSVIANMKVRAYNPSRKITPKIARSCFTFFMENSFLSEQ